MNNYIVYDQIKDVENSSGIWGFKNNEESQHINEGCAQEKKGSGSRKIKPIQNPALKLKTPIAYQRDSDPNMLPIEKEGRGKPYLHNILVFGKLIKINKLIYVRRQKNQHIFACNHFKNRYRR